MKKLLIIFCISVFLSKTGEVHAQNNQYDSMRYSYLPKYELYGRFFNPFEIDRTGIYKFDFGLKIHRKNYLYYKINFISNGKHLGNTTNLLCFSWLWRLTPKYDWIHFEIGAGLGISYARRTPIIWYDQNLFGAGPIVSAEVQFDIGNRANIAVGSYISSQIHYSINTPNQDTIAVSIPSNSIGLLLHAPIRPSAFVAFNFYFK